MLNKSFFNKRLSILTTYPVSNKILVRLHQKRNTTEKDGKRFKMKVAVANDHSL